MGNVSFTSKFNFVDAKTFDKFRRGVYVDYKRGALPVKISKNPSAIDNLADEFHTDEGRTCSLGAIVDTKNGIAAGFHRYDDYENLLTMDEYLKYLFSLVKNPDRALILGSKNLKFSNYSKPIFEMFVNEISKRVKNVTIFREHLFPYSETDLHYSANNDTYTIHSMFRLRTGITDYDVTSPDLLKNSFKEVIIADGDELLFNGQQCSKLY